MLFIDITEHYFTPQQSWPWYILMGNMANPDILHTPSHKVHKENTIFWAAMQCRSVGVHLCFRGKYRLHFQYLAVPQARTLKEVDSKTNLPLTEVHSITTQMVLLIVTTLRT